MGSVIAEYHPATFEAFFSEPLKDFPSLADDLLADFVHYKSMDQLPATFGRDAPYVEPWAAFDAGIMHIHLKLPPEFFPKKRPQFDRTTDTALVYVRGDLEDNRYMIFGVLHPNAHAQAREERIMRYLARLAKEFRDTH